MHRQSLAAGATGTTDPVDVDFRIARQLVAENRRQALDVEAARGHVVATSTEQLRLAKRTRTSSRSRCSSSPLSASTGESARLQLVGNILGIAPRVAEHQRRFGPVLAEQESQGLELARALDLVEDLFDLFVAEQGSRPSPRPDRAAPSG
jgi:hypothetical protein